MLVIPSSYPIAWEQLKVRKLSCNHYKLRLKMCFSDRQSQRNALTFLKHIYFKIPQKYYYKPRWLMLLTDVQILSGDYKKCSLLNCVIWQMDRSAVEHSVDYSLVSAVRGKAPACVFAYTRLLESASLHLLKKGYWNKIPQGFSKIVYSVLVKAEHCLLLSRKRNEIGMQPLPAKQLLPLINTGFISYYFICSTQIAL